MTPGRARGSGSAHEARFRLVQALAIAVVIILAVFVSSCGDDDEGVQPELWEPKPVGEETPVEGGLPGVPGFAKVSDVLYRGAQPTREGFVELEKLGVRSVINLRSLHSDRELLEGSGLKYFHVSFKPWHMEEEDVVRFLRIVTDVENQPVFVHCALGLDRTGTMVAVYRMYVEGWTAEEAIGEMEEMGFHEAWENMRGYLRSLDVDAVRELVEQGREPVAGGAG